MPNRFDPLHDRLTVVSVAAGQRGAFAQHLAQDLADDPSAVDLTPISIIRHADIAAVAERLGAERATAHAAALDQARARLDAALHASDLAIDQREALTVEIARRNEDASQCDGVAAHADELYRLVANATAEATARRRDMEAAQQRLDHVLEQRFAGRAAVEGAERELATVAGARLGEVDLRRGRETAVRNDNVNGGGDAAAQRLWEQIEAVRTALDEAEAVARNELDAAVRALAAADIACDRNALLLADASRRAHDLAAALPVDLRPPLGPRPLDGLSDLADALRESLERRQQDLSTAAKAVERAGEEVDLAAADLEMMRAMVDEDSSPIVNADALIHLITRRRGRWTIIDGAFDRAEPATRDALLATVVDASALQAVIVLTDDTDVLGWAIGLPSDVGMVTTAAAVSATGLARSATQLESEIVHPMPVEAALRGCSAG